MLVETRQHVLTVTVYHVEQRVRKTPPVCPSYFDLCTRVEIRIAGKKSAGAFELIKKIPADARLRIPLTSFGRLIEDDLEQHG